MKKHLLNAIVILVAAAGTAFAAGAEIPADGTSIGSQAFRPSNNVHLIVASLPGTSLAIGGFSTASFHSSGNREFATNSAESKIYWRDSPATHIATGDVTVTAGTPPTFTPAYTSGWSSL
jgi:hypothetical protein